MTCAPWMIAALLPLAPVLTVGPAAAHWKPTKPVTVIVPWPAGGATDLTVRIFAGEMEDEDDPSRLDPVNLRRALIRMDGDLTPFFTRPISGILLALTAITLVARAGWVRCGRAAGSTRRRVIRLPR
jgi:hypothetical protein